MVRNRLAASHLLPALLLAAYTLPAALVAVHCVDLLTSDGECYLRMAAHAAGGEFRQAIYGHWSPLGPWLAAPLVAAGLLPRVAFRAMIVLWGGLAVVGTWRLGARLGLGLPFRAAATACAALLALRGSAHHRVDLLVSGLLLLYLDAVMDERVLRSWRRALAAGLLGGAAYLSKQYALPFVLVHATLAVMLHGWAARDGAGSRDAARAWAAALGGLFLVAVPWVAVLSLTLGRLTLGTAGSTALARYGAESGRVGHPAPVGLYRPPPHAPNVWQDPLRAPPAPPPSPLRSTGALRRQLQFTVANLGQIARHLAALDALHLGLACLAVCPVAAFALRRRRRAAFRYAMIAVTAVVYCGGYAVVFAEDERFFWFVEFVLIAATFRLAEGVARSVTRALPQREGRRVLAGVVLAVGASFAWPQVRFLSALLGGPPQGRHHRLLAEELARRGVRGPLASTGERGWWEGLHTAYYLGAKFAGAPRSPGPGGMAAEMRIAGATALLVWGRPALAAALLAHPAFQPVAAFPPGSLPGLRQRVAVFRLAAAAQRMSMASP